MDQNLVGEGISDRRRNKSPETNHLPTKLDEAAREVGEMRQLTRVVQKPPIDFSEGARSLYDDGPCRGMAENKGNLTMGNFVNGKDGLEETIPNKVSSSWVIDSCIDFNPKLD